MSLLDGFEEGGSNNFIISYHNNGQIYRHGRMKNNRPDGFWTFFYENGSIKELSTYKDGKRVSYIGFEYRSNGKLKSQGEFNQYDEPNGLLTFYYENGKIRLQRSFKKGLQVGPFTEYYKNGRVETEGIWNENGKEEGLFTGYYENGNKKIELMLENGILNGPSTEYNKNGDKKFEGIYKNGEIVIDSVVKN